MRSDRDAPGGDEEIGLQPLLERSAMGVLVVLDGSRVSTSAPADCSCADSSAVLAS